MNIETTLSAYVKSFRTKAGRAPDKLLVTPEEFRELNELALARFPTLPAEAEVRVWEGLVIVVNPEARRQRDLIDEQTDTAAAIHLSLFNRSDKANHADNQHPSWQQGYGSESNVFRPAAEHELPGILAREFLNRGGQSMDIVQRQAYLEWVQGFTAARTQRIVQQLQNPP